MDPGPICFNLTICFVSARLGRLEEFITIVLFGDGTEALNALHSLHFLKQAGRKPFSSGRIVLSTRLHFRTYVGRL